MTRPLQLVDGDDAAAVFVSLRQALAGGPAILPRHGLASDGAELPQTVSQPVALVVETSGSTGQSKRVALSADALLAGAAASESALGGPGQWLLALPAHYIAGINVLTRSIAAETEPVMLQGPHFDPMAFAEAALSMDAHLRFTALVPAQLARLIEADSTLEVLRRFDRILLGGQATPQSLLERALELGLNVTRTYGSSETAGGCVYDGIPLATAGVQIVDGQIELSGPMLAEGYLGDPARTAAAFYARDGIRWYRSGDTGELRDGVLRVTGRLDDVIVSGGLKVSLAAIERVVRALPGLSEAVVVAVPHEVWGEVPVVVLSLRAELQLLRDVVEAAEGPQARPHRLIVLDELPLLPSGKVDRRALRALAARSPD